MMALGFSLVYLLDCGWGTLVLVACCVVLVWLVIGVRWRAGRLPPGPMGLPFLGYLPFLSEEPFKDFIELGKKYGDVFSLRLGTERVLVLNSAEAIREAYLKPDFLGRPPVSTLDIINPGSPFFSADMHLWLEQRRFVVRALKDLGLGRTVIEDAVRDEVGYFLDALSKHDSSAPIDIHGPLSASISNNISALIIGRRLPYDHPDKKLLDSNLETAVRYISQTDNYIYFPWLKHVPFLVEWFQINKAIQAYAKIRNYFSREIENHKTTLDPKNPRDLLDVYLMEMEESKSRADTSYTEHSLLGTLADIFEAGSETTRVTMLWCVYIAAAFPEIQKKVREDVRESGSGDMRSAPYAHAYILEVMRWKTLVPLNVLHCTLQDTTLAGFDIPEGTYVMGNLWNVHHDPKHWKDPDTFRPERFLDGRTVRKPAHFMPFSVGKRACPGESMAYLEIFHYLSAILKHYEISFPEGAEKPPNFAAQTSLNYRPLPFEVRLTPVPV